MIVFAGKSEIFRFAIFNGAALIRKVCVAAPPDLQTVFPVFSAPGIHTRGIGGYEKTSKIIRVYSAVFGEIGNPLNFTKKS